MAWVGHLCAGLAFLLVGAGLQTTQTTGLALATDLASEESRPRVVALMYVMLLLGMVGGGTLCSTLLTDFSFHTCASPTPNISFSSRWNGIL